MEECEEATGRRETASTQQWCTGSFASPGAELGRSFLLFRVQDVSATSKRRVLGPVVGASTVGCGGALAGDRSEHTVHVARPAGPHPQDSWGSCTGSPAGTRSGQEMGLPCSCQ